MKRVFVDTGAWYALIDAKDPDHPAVAACLAQYGGKLATSNFVFDKTVMLLRYRPESTNGNVISLKAREDHNVHQ